MEKIIPINIFINCENKQAIEELWEKLSVGSATEAPADEFNGYYGA